MPEKMLVVFNRQKKSIQIRKAGEIIELTDSGLYEEIVDEQGWKHLREILTTGSVSEDSSP